MSRIYNDSFIYCSEIPIDLNRIDTNFLYPLLELYFCPICQYPKAPYQTSFKIDYKFCSNCLTDYTKNNDLKLTKCIKNCFICPECTILNLNIKVFDHDNNGKAFEFNCGYCQYSFKTKVIYKPKPLYKIIMDEMDDPFHKLCQEIKQGVLKQRETRNDTTKIDTNIDELQLKLQNLNMYNNDEDHEEIERGKYPLSNKLTTKKTLRCLDCNNLVFSPIIENIPPTVNKAAVKFNAIDYLPTISMSKILNDQSNWKTHQVMLLHFINPLKTKVHINVSIPSSLQIKHTTENTNLAITTTPIPTTTIKLTILRNEFTLDGNTPGTNVVKTIPTALLTTNTSISKSELILRKGDSMYKQPPSSIEEIEENLDDYIEKGINWCSIPIIIKFRNNKSQFKLPENFLFKLPIYVNLKSDIIPISLAKISDRFSLGYWNVIELNNINIT